MLLALLLFLGGRVVVLILDLAGSVDLTDLFGGVEGAPWVSTRLLLCTHVVARGVCNDFTVLLVNLHRVPRRHHVACSVLAVAGGRGCRDTGDDAPRPRRMLLIVLMHVAVAISCCALGGDCAVLMVVLEESELLVRAAQLLELRLARAVVNGRDLLLALLELLVVMDGMRRAHINVVHHLLLLLKLTRDDATVLVLVRGELLLLEIRCRYDGRTWMVISARVRLLRRQLHQVAPVRRLLIRGYCIVLVGADRIVVVGLLHLRGGRFEHLLLLFGHKT